MSPRRMKPRAPVVVRPLFVTQNNAFALLGVAPRKFLESIAPKCERSTRIGKTVLVPVDEAERVILELGEAFGEHDAHGADHAEEPQPETAAAVLRALGKELAG